MPIPFSPKNSAPKLGDLVSKTELLSRFTSQVCPLLHDQTDLLSATMAPIILQQTLISLFQDHLSHKTRPETPPNAQLDFIFHGFEPAAGPEAVPVPSTYGELLNLICTGDPAKKPEAGQTDLLPAPFWKLPAVTERLSTLITYQITTICASLVGMLAPSGSDETEPRIHDLLKPVVMNLVDILPDTAFAPESDNQTRLDAGILNAESSPAPLENAVTPDSTPEEPAQDETAE